MNIFIDHIKDILADSGWFFLWIICFASLFLALHDTKEGFEKIKRSTGKARAKALSRFAFFWAVPILSFLGALGTQVASDKAEKTIAGLTNNVSIFSNKLATANVKIDKLATQVRQKPLEERLLFTLSDIDPIIVTALKAGQRADFSGYIRQSQKDALDKLFAEPAASNYFENVPHEASTDFGDNGPTAYVHFMIDQSIIKSESQPGRKLSEPRLELGMSIAGGEELPLLLTNDCLKFQANGNPIAVNPNAFKGIVVVPVPTGISNSKIKFIIHNVSGVDLENGIVRITIPSDAQFRPDTGWFESRVEDGTSQVCFGFVTTRIPPGGSNFSPTIDFGTRGRALIPISLMATAKDMNVLLWGMRLHFMETDVPGKPSVVIAAETTNKNGKLVLDFDTEVLKTNRF